MTETAQALSVKIPSIESQLSKLWEEAEEQGGALSRTVLLTLIALSRNKMVASKASQLISAVAGDHPARAIIISNPPSDGAESISTHVSIACQLVSRSDKRLCTEQVQMEASGASLERIAAAVAPLALPDVPLVFWPADGLPADLDEYARFFENADRVLFDSRLSENRASAFRFVEEKMRRDKAPMVDLAWVDSAPWRLAIAQMFDPGHHRALLGDITGITIRCGCGDELPGACSLLMAGWIASRLQWTSLAPVKLEAGGGWRSGQPSGRNIHFQRTGDADEGITVVRLTAPDKAGFTIQYNRADGTALLESDCGGELREVTVHLGVRSEAQVLCGALEVGRRDPVYQSAINTINQMLADA